jgi:hypothetical protein
MHTADHVTNPLVTTQTSIAKHILLSDSHAKLFGGRNGHTRTPATRHKMILQALPSDIMLLILGLLPCESYGHLSMVSMCLRQTMDSDMPWLHLLGECHRKHSLCSTEVSHEEALIKMLHKPMAVAIRPKEQNVRQMPVKCEHGREKIRHDNLRPRSNQIRLAYETPPKKRFLAGR